MAYFADTFTSFLKHIEMLPKDEAKYRSSLGIEETIFKAKINLLFSQTRTAIAGTLCVLPIVVYYFIDAVPTWILASWVSILILIGIVRFHYAILFRETPENQKNYINWMWIYFTGVQATAFFWGISPWILLSTDDWLHWLIIYGNIIGLAAMAIIFLASIKGFVYAFVLFLVFPPTLKLLVFSSDTFTIGLACTIYMFMAFRVGTLAGRYIDESLRLGIETKLLAKKYKDASEQAMEASNAKSAFLATMSHEIRTPLNGVIGMIDLLFDTSTTEEQSELLFTCKSSAKVLLGIINDILDFSKIEADQITLSEIEFSLNDFKVDLESVFSHVAKECGVIFNVTVNRDAVVIADDHRLKQVLINLIGNSLKFTKRNGKVDVRIEVVEEVESEVAVLFSVADTGIGISEENLAKIFESFSQAEETTSRRFGGTGLGLAISRRLVNLMGGALSVESESGEGSRFFFSIRLPLSDNDNFQSKYKLRTADFFYPDENVELSDLRILVAEDNAVNYLVLSRTLQRWGCQVQSAKNGEEVLRKLENQNFDVILMDCQMPLLDGYEATQKVRLLNSPQKDIRIIAVTANALVDDSLKCKEAGMNDYLSKPVRRQELYQALVRAKNSLMF